MSAVLESETATAAPSAQVRPGYAIRIGRRNQFRQAPAHLCLICDKARRGAGCKFHSIRYEECEDVILQNLREIQPETVLPNPDEQAQRCRMLRDRIQGKRAEMEAVERGIGNLLDQIARTGSASMRDAYEKKAEQLQGKIPALQAEMHADEIELTKAESGLQSFADWQRNFETLKKALKSGDPEIRLRMRSHLREIIDRIEVFPAGDRTDKFREALWDYVDEWTTREDRKALGKFIDALTARRHGKEGRFLRVWFKGGGRVDLAVGPLASGWALGAKGNLSDIIHPDICKLFDEWEAKAGNGRNS